MIVDTIKIFWDKQKCIKLCVLVLLVNSPILGTEAADGGALCVRMSSRIMKLANRLMAEI